jgi:hypothetical protein
VQAEKKGWLFDDDFEVDSHSGVTVITPDDFEKLRKGRS